MLSIKSICGRALEASSFFILCGLSGCSFIDSLNPFSADDVAAPPVSAIADDSPAATKQPDARAVAEPQSAGSPNNQISRVQNLPLEQTSATTSPGTSLEIVWQVPGEPVEAYRLSYGASPGKLENEVRVPVSALRKSDDPSFGPVFSYQLPGISPDQTIFVSMRAENNGLISPPSPLLRISKGEVTQVSQSESAPTSTQNRLKPDKLQ